MSTVLRMSAALAALVVASSAHAQMDPEAGDVWLPPPDDPPPEQPQQGGAQVVIDLQVQSTPPGAQVIANRQVVGVTPLDTQLPVQGGAPVRVTVQLAGYQPHTFEVDPSRPSHSVHAALVPLDGSAPVDPAAGGTGAAQPNPFANADYGERPTHRIGGAFQFFTENNDIAPITVIGLDFGALVRLLGNDEEGQLTMDLAADWSVYAIFAESGAFEESELRPNNPSVSLLLGSRYGIVRVYGGPGLTIPLTAAIDDSNFFDPATGVAIVGRGIHAYMHGAIEPWIYALSHIALHARGGVEVRLDGGSFGAEMALGLLAGIEANYANVPNVLNWQLRFFGGARPIDPISFGGQLGISYFRDLESAGDPDDAVVSIEPYVRGHFDPAFVGLRFLVNLTDPFSFDDNGIWSLTIEAGAELE